MKITEAASYGSFHALPVLQKARPSPRGASTRCQNIIFIALATIFLLLVPRTSTADDTATEKLCEAIGSGDRYEQEPNYDSGTDECMIRETIQTGEVDEDLFSTERSLIAKRKISRDHAYSSKNKIKWLFKVEDVIYVNLRLEMISLMGNGNPDYGGIYFDSPGQLYLDSCEFSRGGSGIVLKTGRNHIIKNTLFKGLYAESGGAIEIWPDAQKIVIEDSTFEANSATKTCGGAIYTHESNSRIRLINTYFRKNVANKGGGAIYAKGAPLISSQEIVIENSTFEENSATETGGAIWNDESSSRIRLINAYFRQNAANKGGGAIYAVSSLDILEIVIENSTFEKNSASETGGGAIYTHESNSSIRLINTYFRKNAAKKGGGAIYAKGAPLISSLEIVIEDSAFEANSAMETGGAIYAADVILNISGSFLHNNVASSLGESSLNRGGALALNSSISDIALSVFYGNKVISKEQREAGAGILMSASSVFLEHVSFHHNIATNESLGVVSWISSVTAHDSILIFRRCNDLDTNVNEDSMCANVPHQKKIDCKRDGEKELNDTVCRSRGCCWSRAKNFKGEEIHSGVPWCFNKSNIEIACKGVSILDCKASYANANEDGMCADVPHQEKIDCKRDGEKIFNDTVCRSRGCCWSRAKNFKGEEIHIGVPWCFTKPPIRKLCETTLSDGETCSSDAKGCLAEGCCTEGYKSLPQNSIRVEPRVAKKSFQILENINGCRMVPRDCTPLSNSPSPSPLSLPLPWPTNGIENGSSTETIIVVDPRLSQMVVQRTEKNGRRQLTSVHGGEKLVLRGRDPPSIFNDLEASRNNMPHKLYYNFLNGSKLSILGGSEIELNVEVGRHGRSIMTKLPPYKDLCKRANAGKSELDTVCADGFYLSIEILVPLFIPDASAANLSCLLPEQMEVLADDTIWCRIGCGIQGEEDFSSCPPFSSGGALYLLKHSCEGFNTGEVCLNEQTAHRCAYQTVGSAHQSTSDIVDITGEREGKGDKSASMSHECRACMRGAICPGGSRVWPQIGYWVASESDLLAPKKCPAPARERCRGWDVVQQSTKCGTGYAEFSFLCGQCRDGYFHTIDNRTCRPCDDAAAVGETQADITEIWIFVGVICGVLVLLSATIVCVTTYIGGNFWMGVSRGGGFIYYSLSSLQILAQVGQQATGYESPTVLKIYKWMSIVSSVDTTEGIHVECIKWGGYFMLDNLFLASILSIYATWVILTYFDAIVCCCGSPVEHGRSCMLYFRRYLLSGMILLYCITARVATRATACVQPSPNSPAVLISRPTIICNGELHAVNGMLGWATFILYCVGFPFLLMWFALRSQYFDHTKRKTAELEGEMPVCQYPHIESTINPMVFSQDGETVGKKSVDDILGNNTDGKETNVALHNHQKMSSRARLYNLTREKRTKNLCCHCARLDHARKRQRASTLKFVRHRLSTYISFKPLVDSGFHLKYLVFLSVRLMLLLWLTLIGVYVTHGDVTGAWLRFGLGGVVIIAYPVILLCLQPLRRTQLWKLPVICSIHLVTFVALLLHLFAAIGRSGIVHVLSTLLVVAVSVLIALVIPAAAVTEIFLGARRDVMCAKTHASMRSLVLELKGNSNGNEGGSHNLEEMLMLGLYCDENEALEDLVDEFKQRRGEKKVENGVHGINTQLIELTTAVGFLQGDKDPVDEMSLAAVSVGSSKEVEIGRKGADVEPTFRTTNRKAASNTVEQNIPSGWHAQWDPTYQAWYYYNAQGETRWSLNDAQKEELKTSGKERRPAVTENNDSRLSKEYVMRSELSEDRDNILSRIREKFSNGNVHHKKSTGINISSQRGDWLEVFDEVSKKTVYLNQKTSECRMSRPPGWVKFLARAFEK